MSEIAEECISKLKELNTVLNDLIRRCRENNDEEKLTTSSSSGNQLIEQA